MPALTFCFRPQPTSCRASNNNNHINSVFLLSYQVTTQRPRGSAKSTCRDHHEQLRRDDVRLDLGGAPRRAPTARHPTELGPPTAGRRRVLCERRICAAEPPGERRRGITDISRWVLEQPNHPLTSDVFLLNHFPCKLVELVGWVAGVDHKDASMTITRGWCGFVPC